MDEDEMTWIDEPAEEDALLGAAVPDDESAEAIDELAPVSSAELIIADSAVEVETFVDEEG